jgi:hypothetical protein
MTDTDFRDFIEKVKAANAIEDVIQETGGAEFKLRSKRGNYLIGETHDSFKVRVDEQYYVWNSTSERGDVFNWLERHAKMDFWSALQWLAERARMPMPEQFKPRGNEAQRLAAKVRTETWTIAAQLFAAWLWKDEDALAYTRGRGWSDETIRESGIGFSGRATAAEFKEMGGEFAMHGVEKDSPQAVAVMGFRGDMKGWAAHWEIKIGKGYIEHGWIPGMMGHTRLVYPHWLGGRVRYLSGRNILGAEEYKEGDKVRIVKSFNPPADIAGPRQPFYNHAYGKAAEECVVVEGPGDAVSLAELDIPAMATLGTSWKDMVDMMTELRKRHRDLYLGVDNDEAGQAMLIGERERYWPLADLFGPMGRIVSWPNMGEESCKDANDYLKIIKGQVQDLPLQVGEFRKVMAAATPFAVAAAGWAGGQEGTVHDDAVSRALSIIAQMDPVLLASYRERLADAMRIGVREFNNMVKAEREKAKSGQAQGLPLQETLGGSIGGYLVEYLWDEEENKAWLAYRDPEGHVDTAEHLIIDDVKYIPKTPNSLIISKGILFPSKVGNLKSTRELVAIVETFINQHYLLDDRIFGRMAAYYVLLTWLYDSFSAISYIRATGDAGSGKSELMKRIGHICYRLMNTGGAGTAASLFRAIDEFRGTVFMDEMDLQDGGDMANDLIKILNLGAMKGNPIWRLNEVINEDGTRSYDVAAYNIFGPKLIAMRKEFKDQAVTSRCLTIRLMGKEVRELKLHGIKLHRDEEFNKQALAIRNLLLRWRLEKWQPEIEVGEELMDLEVPARLNQVTMPLKAIAKDDPELMRDVTAFVRQLNEDLILERSMGLDARVMEALVTIREDPKYVKFLGKGDFAGFGETYYAFTKYVAAVANELMDEMNIEEVSEGEDESKKKKPKGTTSQTVGRIARQTLQLPCKRLSKGFVIIYQEEKMEALKFKYGIVREVTEAETVKNEAGNVPDVPESPENGQDRFVL